MGRDIPQTGAKLNLRATSIICIPMRTWLMRTPMREADEAKEPSHNTAVCVYTVLVGLSTHMMTTRRLLQFVQRPFNAMLLLHHMVITWCHTNHLVPNDEYACMYKYSHLSNEVCVVKSNAFDISSTTRCIRRS